MILALKKPEFKIFDEYNILHFEFPDFKISAGLKILAFQTPKFNIFLFSHLGFPNSYVPNFGSLQGFSFS